MIDERYNNLVKYAKKMHNQMIDDLFPDKDTYQPADLIMILALNLDALIVSAKFNGSALDVKGTFLELLELFGKMSRSFESEDIKHGH